MGTRNSAWSWRCEGSSKWQGGEVDIPAGEDDSHLWRFSVGPRRELQLRETAAAQQRSDGGWAQIPSLPSDAYATGQALVALRESGAVTLTDSTFTRGVQFLMSTQLADGSWFVKSRAMRIQPFFESGFPYGRDQFVSAAGTNWATQALALAAR